MTELTERRVSFGRIAERYDAIRPRYPQAAIDALLRLTGIGAGADVLEIGAGSGQATSQLAAAGLKIVALEPSAEMVEILERRFAPPLGAGLVDVRNGDFETSELSAGAFDMIVAASAWHWLTERVRWEKALQLVRPGGAIVAIWHWPLWRRTALRGQLDAVYAASGAPLERMGSMLEFEPTLEPLRADWLADVPEPCALTSTSSFEYTWDHSYTTAEYVTLINTYADHIALPTAVRERLDHSIAEVIDRAGGTIVLPYKTFLLIALTR